MSDPAIQTGRNPIEQFGEEFVERLRNGERPALSEYIARRPDLEDEIKRLFPALIMLEQAGSQDGSLPADVPVTRDGTAPEQIGEYRILRELGRGGMGVVYEAEQESLGRHVALKVLPFAALMDPNHLKRFQREARAAARLHHTNIVPVHGVGEHDGIHYYAMQFIQGQGLDEVLSELMAIRGEGSRLPKETSSLDAVGDCRNVRSDSEASSETSAADHSSPSRVSNSSASDQEYFRSVARIGAPVANALSYAHQQGILHRDVKPSNLMLDTDGHIWITDFGLAKTDAQEDLTHTGDLVGTLRYMAPERFDGWSDPRSDIYGLGLTLYEMLTLRSAYKDSDRARLIKRITHDELPRPRRLDRNIPVDLETIVLKSVAKEPGDRYQSADQLAADLRRFLNKQPIEARRTSPAERTRMWCRRNPLVATLAGALAVLLVLGSGGAVWAAVHFERVARQRQQTLESKNELVGQLTAAKRIATERLYYSGRYHYDRKEYDLAVKDFNALLAADPNHGDSLWWRGLTYGHLDQCQKATDDFSRFIALNPNLARGYAVRGLYHGRSGNFRRAVEDYRKALELGTQHAGYLNNLALFQIMRSPDDRDLDEALQCSLRAVAKAPRSRTYRTTLGIVHYRRKEYARAIEVLTKAGRLPSRYSFHYYFLAMSHQQRGELDRAVHCYRRANDKMVWGRNEPRFRLREQTLYCAEAEALITTYLNDQPDHFELLFRRAEFRMQLDKFNGVIRGTTRMIELRPKEHHGYSLRASALRMLKRDEEAVRDLQQSLTLNPRDARTMRELAWVHLMRPEQSRDLKLARELAESAVQLKPGSPHYLLTKCVADYRLGRYETARDNLEKAASSPDDGVHTVRLLFLAMTYQKLNQPGKARESYEEALRRWQASYCRPADLEAIRAEAKALVMNKQ